jgi:hypothetical protein
MNYVSIVRIRVALAVLLTFGCPLTVFAQTDPATNTLSRAPRKLMAFGSIT